MIWERIAGGNCVLNCGLTEIALPLALGLGAAGSVASSVVGSKAAQSAADQQAAATKYASELQAKSAADALQFQREQADRAQGNAAPFLAAGTQALGDLSQRVQAGGDLVKPYDKTFEFSPFKSQYQNFTAPTQIDEQNDPGFQARLQAGQQALERSAAARGSSFGGGAMKELSRYAQDYASNEYGNVFNRALTANNVNFQRDQATQQLNYGQAADQFDRSYNIFRQNQGDIFNKEASLAGVGQTAVGQLNSAGANFANNAANITTGLGNNLAANTMAGANAQAAGTIGSANAISSGIGGVSNNLNNILLLSKLFGASGGGGSVSGGGLTGSGNQSIPSSVYPSIYNHNQTVAK